MKKIIKKLFDIKAISYYTAILTFSAAVLGLFAANTIKVTTDQVKLAQNDYIEVYVENYYTDNKSVAVELRNAQNAFTAGDYSYAIEIYRKYKDSNAVAALNLGYMYSHGIGVDFSFDDAAKYYLSAYKLGLRLGLSNYISLHFLKPSSLEESLSALLFCVERELSFATKYAAFLESGELYTEVSTAKNAAIQFSKRHNSEQLLLLKNNLCENISKIVYLEEDNHPISTNLVTYEKQEGTYTQRYIERTVTQIEQRNNAWVKKEVPVYNFKIYNIYRISYCSYKFSDFVFEEKFYTD